MGKTLVYQLYPRTWQGLRQMESHLDRIAALGADYVWLSPIYPSPGYDHGYDVSDYKDVDPRFGAMKDFAEFTARAHDLGIGVVMDLVMNHTSTEHPWFKTHPEYYCWSRRNRLGWRNLFDGGPAWEYNRDTEQYYLHLFHKEQADLNWFPDGPEGDINWALEKEFKDIVSFWLDEGLVDGFRIDAPQAMNKDVTSAECAFDSLVKGSIGAEIVRHVISGTDAFTFAEVIDPTMGSVVDLWAKESGVDFVMNTALKAVAANDMARLITNIKIQSKNQHFMLELESHDAPRLPSRGINARIGIRAMFDSSAKAICLYQGQELGLGNPSIEELPNDLMLRLDAETAMKVARGEDINTLRPTSRANARMPLPLEEYERQEQDQTSCLNFTKRCIEDWRNRPY